MSIDRRQLLVAALSAPVLAMPLSAVAASRIITWEPGALGNRHALMVGRTLHEVLRERVLYMSGEFTGMGRRIDLIEPRFVVRPSDVVFHPTRGFRYEDVLEVEFFERGVRLGQSFMVSHGDYEAYWEKPKPAEYPDYYLRSVHVPYDDSERGRSPWKIHDSDWNVVEEREPPAYETVKGIEDKLGRDAIGFDTRWIDAWAAEQKKLKGKPTVTMNGTA